MEVSDISSDEESDDSAYKDRQMLEDSDTSSDASGVVDPSQTTQPKVVQILSDEEGISEEETSIARVGKATKIVSKQSIQINDESDESVTSDEIRAVILENERLRDELRRRQKEIIPATVLEAGRSAKSKTKLRHTKKIPDLSFNLKPKPDKKAFEPSIADADAKLISSFELSCIKNPLVSFQTSHDNSASVSSSSAGSGGTFDIDLQGTQRQQLPSYGKGSSSSSTKGSHSNSRRVGSSSNTQPDSVSSKFKRRNAADTDNESSSKPLARSSDTEYKRRRMDGAVTDAGASTENHIRVPSNSSTNGSVSSNGGSSSSAPFTQGAISSLEEAKKALSIANLENHRTLDSRNRLTETLKLFARKAEQNSLQPLINGDVLKQFKNWCLEAKAEGRHAYLKNLLEMLDSLPISVDAIKNSDKIGKVISDLTKLDNEACKKLADNIKSKWKEMVEEYKANSNKRSSIDDVSPPNEMSKRQKSEAARGESGSSLSNNLHTLETKLLDLNDGDTVGSPFGLSSAHSSPSPIVPAVAKTKRSLNEYLKSNSVSVGSSPSTITRASDPTDTSKTGEQSALQSSNLSAPSVPTKKGVRWRDEVTKQTISDIRIFESEHSPANSTNYADARRIDSEQYKLALAHGARSEWYQPLRVVRLPSEADVTVQSVEADIQRDRERAKLAATYYSDRDIPDSPAEPEAFEVSQVDDSRVPLIPLEQSVSSTIPQAIGRSGAIRIQRRPSVVAYNGDSIAMNLLSSLGSSDIQPVPSNVNVREGSSYNGTQPIRVGNPITMPLVATEGAALLSRINNITDSLSNQGLNPLLFGNTSIGGLPRSNVPSFGQNPGPYAPPYGTYTPSREMNVPMFESPPGQLPYPSNPANSNWVDPDTISRRASRNMTRRPPESAGRGEGIKRKGKQPTNFEPVRRDSGRDETQRASQGNRRGNGGANVGFGRGDVDVNQICHYFRSGSCRYGEKCLRRHE